jgi:hypothetical protein
MWKRKINVVVVFQGAGPDFASLVKRRRKGTLFFGIRMNAGLYVYTALRL